MNSSEETQPVSTELVIREVNEKVDRISPEDREKIEKIKNDIDVRNSQKTLLYAEEPQRSIASFSDSILGQVRNKDSGIIGDQMRELLAEVNDFNVDLNSGGGFLDNLPFVKLVRNKIEGQLRKYETLEKQVNLVQSKLEVSQKELLKDIGMFDNLYNQNLNFFNELNLYIVAGEEKIEIYRNETIPRLRTEAENLPEEKNRWVYKR